MIDAEKPPVSELESPKLKIAGKSQPFEAKLVLETIRNSRMIKERGITTPMLVF